MTTLAIYYVTHHDMPLPEKIKPPIENEDFSSNEREMDSQRHNWKFKDIVNQLKDNKFFDISDAETAKDIFNAYRNPLVHGLPSRLVDKDKMRDFLFWNSPIKLFEIEKFIESNWLIEISKIADILVNNQIKQT
ncbi:hypothetical protein [Shewanella surugensis]|uniref:Uncharacterized protein n=1 Tax=Shewanella surugensis TaxID=212020 RepID=A0ABT0LF78_9GAMM|nr:hypothetical protein [Shewanella surugensis]MCL1125995.1 hypothetical protein [Shewanella surugensis]